jgi:hypothetical protein
MIITNTTLMGFSSVIATWQVQLALLFQVIFVQLVNKNVEIKDIEGREYTETCRLALLYITVNHAYLFTVLTVFTLIKTNHDFADAAFKIIGMGSQLFCLIKAGEMTYIIHWQKVRSSTVDTIGTFFLVEMLVTTNIIFANILFLFIRAFVKHKVHPEFKMEKKRQLQQIDTLKALAPIVDSFVNITVPILTTVEI